MTFGKLRVGSRVIAIRRVYDLPGENFGPPHPRVLEKYPFADNIHAEAGDIGHVVGIDNVDEEDLLNPKYEVKKVTVTFDLTGTTSDVVAEEVQPAGEDYDPTWKNIFHSKVLVSVEDLRHYTTLLGFKYFCVNGRVIPVIGTRDQTQYQTTFDLGLE